MNAPPPPGHHPNSIPQAAAGQRKNDCQKKIFTQACACAVDRTRNPKYFPIKPKKGKKILGGEAAIPRGTGHASIFIFTLLIFPNSHNPINSLKPSTLITLFQFSINSLNFSLSLLQIYLQNPLFSPSIFSTPSTPKQPHSSPPTHAPKKVHTIATLWVCKKSAQLRRCLSIQDLWV
jgi:hypothetical protein